MMSSTALLHQFLAFYVYWPSRNLMAALHSLENSDFYPLAEFLCMVVKYFIYKVYSHSYAIVFKLIFFR